MMWCIIIIAVCDEVTGDEWGIGRAGSKMGGGWKNKQSGQGVEQ